jgi:hypothetical protein
MGGRLSRFVASGGLLLTLTSCQLVPGETSAALDKQYTDHTVRQLVDRFIAAFNRGDLAQLDQLFAVPENGFNWYATDAPGQRLNAEADNRGSLMAYFAARHLQHEHLVLRSLDVTFTDGGRGGFWFRLTRSADDGLPPTAYNGKGEVQCMFAPGSITVWAMDPYSWSPIELLPEAAAALLLLAVAGVAVGVWRRRAARRPQLTGRGGRSSSWRVR